ncbi:hypothetical protein [Xanthocytophaga flava]|uniref:hypothetical protein n=1 Tax=Xanthocytophaga flava TaxID=3048013 RepID=UPI0028D438B4|nr:hypothetical protein [Xanthocytophaga flavus]MDJ1470915.1 hypothetical protein [Xanthocytophaga flavus]
MPFFASFFGQAKNEGATGRMMFGTIKKNQEKTSKNEEDANRIIKGTIKKRGKKCLLEINPSPYFQKHRLGLYSHLKLGMTQVSNKR